MSLYHAKQQFKENIRLLGPSAVTTAPEKVNLYNGLLNLVEALERMSQDVQYIRSKVDR